MGIINSSFSAVSAVFDAASAAIEGASTEAQRWSRRRTATQGIRDSIYVMESISELEKAQRKFEKLNVSSANVELYKKVMATLSE